MQLLIRSPQNNAPHEQPCSVLRRLLDCSGGVPWIGCIVGALQDTECREKLKAAGFEQIEIEPTRVYKAEDARQFLTG